MFSINNKINLLLFINIDFYPVTLKLGRGPDLPRSKLSIAYDLANIRSIVPKNIPVSHDYSPLYFTNRFF